MDETKRCIWHSWCQEDCSKYDPDKYNAKDFAISNDNIRHPHCERYIFVKSIDDFAETGIECKHIELIDDV